MKPPEGRWRTPSAPRPALTPREREITRLSLEGMNQNEIALALYVSQKTVEAHISTIMIRLDGHGPHGRILPMLRYAVEHDHALLPGWLRERLDGEPEGDAI